MLEFRIDLIPSLGKDMASSAMLLMVPFSLCHGCQTPQATAESLSPVMFAVPCEGVPLPL